MGLGELGWRLKRVLNQAVGKTRDGDGETEGRERYSGIRRLGMKASMSLLCRTRATEKSQGVTVYAPSTSASCIRKL